MCQRSLQLECPWGTWSPSVLIAVKQTPALVEAVKDFLWTGRASTTSCAASFASRKVSTNVLSGQREAGSESFGHPSIFGRPRTYLSRRFRYGSRVEGATSSFTFSRWHYRGGRGGRRRRPGWRPSNKNALEKLLASQTLLLEKLAPGKAAAQDPLRSLASGSSLDGDEGTKSLGVKGLAARQFLVKNFRKHPARVFASVPRAAHNGPSESFKD